LVCVCALALATACGDGAGSTVGVGANGSGASSGNGQTGGTGTGGSLSLNDGGQSQPGPGAAGDSGDGCAADFAAAKLRPVHLAFAFDVSGSMGKLDLPYHDPELKWRPVVAATRAFFEDESSAGISASLTFFPAEDDKCDASVYEQPDVTRTELPSDAFGAAISAIDPKTADDWRGGTPTLAVVKGSVEYLTSLAASAPDAQHALVLVTDGYPQGCDDEDDEIATVAAAIKSAAPQFPTYVIGVKNPAGGPDTVTDLESLAKAGGTEHAILINTGDASQTSADLRAAIARIRERSVSCDAAIPATPGGAPFDSQKVNVSMQLGGKASQLGYDQSCEAESAWRYDDEQAPTSIVLCPATCETVQQDATAQLSVEFGCQTRPIVK
jgi:hypothetical protein